MSSKNQPSGSWDEQLRYWIQLLSNTRSKLEKLHLEVREAPHGIESTWVEKLQDEIEECDQEIKDINVKIREAEEGRKQALKKQMEKVGQQPR